MKSARTIRRNLVALRRLIDDQHADRVTVRIAYAMETAVRWATEETVGWPGLVEEAKTNAAILKHVDLLASRVGR